MVYESAFLTLLAIAISTFHLLGALSALEALYYSRSSQGAIAWCLFLCIFPYAGLPAYWILGRSKFRGYREQLEHVAKHQSRGVAWFHNVENHHAAQSTGNDPVALAQFLDVCGRPCVGGNSAELLIDGEATFAAIFDAIDSARRDIMAEFFIIKDDRLGSLFKTKLLDAAARGVKVFLIYDEVGSHTLPRNYLRELQNAGVKVTPFGTRRGLANFFQVNFRNHRKIVIVDGQVAFLGGLNVGDEYMGRHTRFKRWRDTHIKLSGPTVSQALRVFASDWVWATGAGPDIELTEPTPTGNLAIATFGTGPADEYDRCILFFLHCITSARSRVWISSPYFVPDDALLSALQLAALRGVDVRLILPAKRDHYLVWLASFFFVPAVTRYGVKAYRYHDGFLHQKALVIDDSISAIGSVNFDNRSFRLNFEATSVLCNQAFTEKVASMLSNDMASSRDVSAERFEDLPWWLRLAAKFARLFAPVL